MSRTNGSISAALVGATGLTGSAILQHLLAHPAITPVHALIRRALPASTVAPGLTPHVADSSEWAATLAALQPTVFLSALGTTRAAAGSVAAQRAIDYDLNLALATAARDAGVGTYVLVSSAGTSAASHLPYSKMKGELEAAVKTLEFPHTVILRPGLLVGTRTESRLAEGILRGVASGLMALSPKLTDFWAQDVDVIGRAAVKAAVECAEGRRDKGVWVLEQADIVRMGTPDVKGGESST